MKKIKIIILILIGFIFLLWVSCKKKEKILKVAFPNTFFIYDPHQTSWATDCKINSNIFEPLVKVNQNLMIRPFLAERWYNVSPLEWIFDIRKGVKFFNGKELTAEIVKRNFERIATKELYSPYRQISTKIKSIKVLGKYKILLKLKKECDDFLLLLSDIKIIYLQNNLFTSIKYKKKKFFGTGPYHFSSIEGNKVILQSFNSYWRGTPKYEKIIFYFNVKDEIEKYDISEVFTVPQKVNKDYELITKASNYIYFLILNIQKEPFDDIKIREFISKQIPYGKILESLKITNSFRIKQLIPNWLRYSLKEVKENRKKIACRKVKTPLVFTYRKTNKISEIAAKHIYRSLKKCFYNLRLEGVDDKEWRKRLFYTRSIDLTLFGYSSDTGGVDDILVKFFHTPVELKGLLNFFEYSNRELDDLINKAEETKDKRIKEKLFREAHKIALESNVFIPLFIVPEFYIVKKKLLVKKDLDLRDIFDFLK